MLIAVSVIEAAPAPAYRGLPPEVNLSLENMLRIFPDLIRRHHEWMTPRTSMEEIEMRLRNIKRLEREFYTEPISYLKNALKDERYQLPSEQEAIKKALTEYQIRYGRAGKKAW